jgi:heme/copper-type cytochrome/quinol oxidase subunit 3
MAVTSERRIIPPPREPSEPIEAMHGVSHGMWGVVIFIASEVMFFAALFTTYFYLRAQHPVWQPPEGGRPGVFPFTSHDIGDVLPTLNTIILVSSSFVIQWAVGRLRRGNRAAFLRGLVATIVMGVLFLSGQGYEYSKLFAEYLVPTSGLFGGVFFALTGFHGAHVTGGVVFFLVVLYRTFVGNFSPRRYLAVEAASIYWHFVDIVWIGLYTTIYVL